MRLTWSLQALRHQRQTLLKAGTALWGQRVCLPACPALRPYTPQYPFPESSAFLGCSGGSSSAMTRARDPPCSPFPGTGCPLTLSLAASGGCREQTHNRCTEVGEWGNIPGGTDLWAWQGPFQLASSLPRNLHAQLLAPREEVDVCVSWCHRPLTLQPPKEKAPSVWWAGDAGGRGRGHYGWGYGQGPLGQPDSQVCLLAGLRVWRAWLAVPWELAPH